MVLVNNDVEFLNSLKDEKIVCFGVSKLLDVVLERGITEWLNNVLYFVDNDHKKHGQTISYAGRTFEIRNPESIKHEGNSVIVIVMTGMNSTIQIIDQLNDMKLKGIKCYSLLMMLYFYVKRYDNSMLPSFEYTRPQIIDKKIHCCWFSGEKKPIEYQNCIDSWKKVCPEYEIIEWNSEKYNIEKNRFMKQAYEKRAWAFVSDYARLDLVYNFGGIYLDMDVELLKPLDPFLQYKAFFSFGESRGCVDLGSGFGSVKGNKLLKALLDQYEDEEFLTDNAEYSSSKMIPQPVKLDPVFRECGFKHNSSSQVIDDMLFLSPDYIRTNSDPLHDKSFLRGDEYAVHWHHAGWYSGEQLEKLRENRNNRKKLLSYDWHNEG